MFCWRERSLSLLRGMLAFGSQSKTYQLIFLSGDNSEKKEGEAFRLCPQVVPTVIYHFLLGNFCSHTLRTKRRTSVSFSRTDFEILQRR